MEIRHLKEAAISSSLFTVYKEGKSLVSEFSTLQGNGLQAGQLYDDAADYGFWVKSERTGKLMAFSGGNREYDDEGELISETYYPADVDLMEKGWTLVVYND